MGHLGQRNFEVVEGVLLRNSNSWFVMPEHFKCTQPLHRLHFAALALSINLVQTLQWVVARFGVLACDFFPFPSLDLLLVSWGLEPEVSELPTITAFF